MKLGWVLTAALAVACGDQPNGSGPAGQVDAGAPIPRFLEPPAFQLAPRDEVPLAGELSIRTDLDTRITITLEGERDLWTVAFDGIGTDHNLPVLGMRPDSSYALTATAITAAGTATVSAPIEFATEDVPDGFPTIELYFSDPTRMEPGFTLFTTGDYMVAVDELGEVVWYHRDSPGPHDVRRTDDGNLVLGRDDWGTAREIDMLGRPLRRWHASGTTGGESGSVAVATDTFHHEFHPVGDDKALALSTEVRSYDNYPTSEVDPTPRAQPLDLVGDVIVEFDLGTGEIERSWSLLDTLDPYRVGYDSFGTFWTSTYADSIDWSHANGVIPAGDGIVVSVRHQDAVVKIDGDGEIEWILGPPENWSEEFQPYLLTPVGEPFRWSYHTHAPAWTPQGTLLLFDNGNHGASPPTEPLPEEELFSRAVEYEIDPVAMTVRQVWTYDAEQSLYARFLGDADWLTEKGNVLVTFGGQRRLIEVSHTRPALEVFDLFVEPGGTYRSERIPSLYPPAATVTRTRK